MDAIATDIKFKLLESGYKKITVTYTLHPAWTTDWMTDSGKKKLQAYGIAPPISLKSNPSFSRIQTLLLGEDVQVPCPQCHSLNTKMLSQFGSTACKSLYQCNDCKEPFDYFKCH
jgi:ring-1,2-phenylacetyl-CoA epoxidase subunit PaaD